MSEKTPATHSLLDNLQGQASGVLMTSFAVVILKSAGLVTGQTAGLSLLLSYATGYSFGVVFFVVNIPFYAFALQRMGWRFTVRSLVSATLISVLADFAPNVVTFAEVNIWAAALLGGCTAAMGLIALFRHGASAGGLGILALYVQDKTGFRAGWLQLIVDAMIFIASAFFLDSWAVAASFLGAAVVNVLIAFNHRKDWYVAQ
jgi:uncharacterized membrane-anchored protein YitT (DUF2179 family)